MGCSLPWGIWLLGFAPIHPQQHRQAWALMLGKKAWLPVGIPVQTKGIGWGWGQGSVQVSQLLPHQTLKTFSFWTLLCARGALSCWNRKGFSSNYRNNVGYVPKDRGVYFYLTLTVCMFKLVYVRAGLSCLYSNFLLLGSPDSCCKRQRSHTNQLTVIALFTTPRHKRGGKESKQTPITVRHEEGGNRVWALFVIMCFLLYSQTKQEGQRSCVHREDTSISVWVFVLWLEEWDFCWV